MFAAARASSPLARHTLNSKRGRVGLVLALALGALGAAPAPVFATVEPVLLVHGYRGSASSFETMKARFIADGRQAVAISLPSQDNIVNGRAIRDFITARGWARVDIVGHSMGGLSSRYFAKSLSGTAKLDAYVSLGTPQYGIYTACLLPSWYGGQMCPSSSFISNLNSGDDTPGDTAYATLYSTGDTYVPNSRSRLDGGACHIQVSGVSHSGLLTDASVYRLARTATQGGCPGTFVG
jgi:triacylglycerol lipase